MIAPKVSLVIPVLNEEASLPGLLDSLDRALAGIPFEAIFVDDGSTDGSLRLLEDRARADARVKVISFIRNFGQTPALAAGIDMARGDAIVCLDADGQNDPADIPGLLDELGRGADVVSGWRYPRRDPFLTRRLPSFLANHLISCVTGVRLHDYGCTLKAYRRHVLQGLRLYGEMHRFLPAWCAWKGAKITEVRVRHHPRRLGKSKYGIVRTFKVLLDLITAKFFASYLTKPSYFFGGAGLALLFFSVIAGLLPIYDKFVLDSYGHLRIPFMILSIFLGLLGAQFIVFGLLAEILIRIYYENKGERPYQVAKIVGVADDDPTRGK
ncbi:MAG TPA: glycosyltransferase family 2 protein [Elusimicrobiota bacterium]|nr:glycosyltransferase family 2 protein [Elusimicrobiota bacterium]